MTKKNVFSDNPRKNIENKVQKTGKIGQDYKFFVSIFPCFLTAIAKV